MEVTIHLAYYEAFDVDVETSETASGQRFTVVGLGCVRPLGSHDDAVTIYVHPEKMAEVADKFEFIASELRAQSGSVDS